MTLDRRIGALLLTGIACTLTCLGPGSQAADWSLSPSLEIGGEYNSDVLLSSEGNFEDYIFRGKPALQVLGMTQKTKFLFDSVLIGEKYFQEPGFDTVDTNTRVSLSHQWTPSLSTDLSTTFVKDTTLETELEAAGLQTARSDRFQYGLDLSSSISLSETASLGLSGSAEKSDYPDGQYPEELSWEAGLNPAWMFSPANTLGLNTFYSSSDYEDSSTVRTVSAVLYWLHDWSEKDHFTLGGGYFHTWNEIKEPNLETTDDGFLFNLEFNRAWTESFSTVLSAGRDQYDSVDARSVTRNYARTTLNYVFSPVLSSSCAIGYDFNTQSGTFGEDTHYFRVAPSVRWRLAENVSLSVSGAYEHSRTEAEVSDDRTDDRYRAWLALLWQWPRLLASN